MPSRRARSVEPKQSGGGLRVVLVLLLLVAGAGAGGLWWFKNQHKPLPVVLPIGPTASDKAAVAFQQGKNLAREGKWAEAKARFEEALALDAELPGVDQYLARAGAEIPNQEHLNAANAALDNDQLGPAAAALGKVTEDTVQHDPVTKVKTRLAAAISKKLGEARGLSTSPNDLGAQRKLEALSADVLAAQPENRDAKSLNDQARGNIGRITHKPVEVKGPEGPGPWVEVASRFKSGDVSGAFSIANECAGAEESCRTMLAQLTQFQELNKRVETLDAGDLEKLVQLDRAICGGSAAGQAARTRLATQYYKVAAAANQAGQWGRAWTYAAKVLELDRQHPGAQTISSEVKSKAQNVYMSGYEYASRGETDDASKKFKECVEMTLPSDALHAKCKRRLENPGER